MVWLAVLGILSLQDTVPVPDARDLYELPAVRPFEPPLEPGLGESGGDSPPRLYRPPLTNPVTVDVYRQSYEVTLTDADIAYDLGVNRAERDGDSRMGPLDGRWLLLDRESQTMAHLVLVDRGEGAPIEGAWLRPSRPGVAAALEPVMFDPAGDGTVVASLGPLGLLTLVPSPSGGWSASLRRGEAIEPVAIRRP